MVARYLDEPDHARRRSVPPVLGRAADQQLPALAVRLRRAGLPGHAVSRLRPARTCGGPARSTRPGSAGSAGRTRPRRSHAADGLGGTGNAASPTRIAAAPAARRRRRRYRPGSLEIFGLILLAGDPAARPAAARAAASRPMQTWTTIFVAVCVQATPFLVLGVLVSGGDRRLRPGPVLRPGAAEAAGAGRAGGRRLRHRPARLRVRVGADRQPADGPRCAGRRRRWPSCCPRRRSTRSCWWPPRWRFQTEPGWCGPGWSPGCSPPSWSGWIWERIGRPEWMRPRLAQRGRRSDAARPVGVPGHHARRLHPGRRLPGDRRRRRRRPCNVLVPRELMAAHRLVAGCCRSC